MRLRYGKPRRLYYWLRYQVNNSYGILGPCNTEEEAVDKAISELRGYKYEVIPLDTRNKSAASGKLKAVILNETKDITQAMQRVKHKVPNAAPNTEVVRFL